MSRIGKAPIKLPSGVKFAADGGVVTVEGPKGKLNYTMPEGMTLKVEDGVVTVEIPEETQSFNALHGLARTLINNMVIGVTQGFTKVLEIVGVGFRVALKGSTLDFNLGRSHPVTFDAPEGISFVVEGTNKILVQGIDKHLVGQVAANIRMLRKPEPYKGKGIRYQGERIILKAGKSGKK